MDDIEHDPRDDATMDELRRTAYEAWKKVGSGVLCSLDLRAAAQHAQALGDTASERQIDSVLAAREARHA